MSELLPCPSLAPCPCCEDANPQQMHAEVCQDLRSARFNEWQCRIWCSTCQLTIIKPTAGEAEAAWNIRRARQPYVVPVDKSADRIEALEAALRGWHMAGDVLNARIEALEAALRHASKYLSDLEYHWHGNKEAMWAPIRAALAERDQTP